LTSRTRGSANPKTGFRLFGHGLEMFAKNRDSKKTSLVLLLVSAIVDASNLIMSNRVLTARNKTLEFPGPAMLYLKKTTGQLKPSLIIDFLPKAFLRFSSDEMNTKTKV